MKRKMNVKMGTPTKITAQKNRIAHNIHQRICTLTHSIIKIQKESQWTQIVRNNDQNLF